MSVAGVVSEYLQDKATSDEALGTIESGQWVLHPELAYYGCPFCHGQERRPHRPGFGTPGRAYTYVRCRSCEIVYPWPRLTRDALIARGNAPWLNRYLEQTFAGTPYWPDFVPFPEPRLRRLAGCKVLEVGPGPGQVLDYLRQIGAEAIGVELNAVAAARCRGRGLRVLEASFDRHLLDRPEIGRGFDAVVFLESVYHLFDLEEALRVAHQLLRRGGQLILKTFDVDSLAMRHFPRASLGIDGLSIPTNASARTYRALLTQVGFTVTTIVPCPGQPLDYVGRTGWLLNRIVDRLLRVLRQSRNVVLFAQKR
jgi:SAM-dependent methyltransferase